jgi:Protein of unknown function (DUF1552)
MKMSKRYGRRAFLGGAAGVIIGLPFLETLAPKKVGAAGTAPKRFLGYWYPNGYYMIDWRPTGTGTNFTFGNNNGPGNRVWTDGLGTFPATEDGPGLDSVKSQILMISGLANTHQPTGVPGDHSGGTGSFLTDRSVSMDVNAKMGGPSIDYLISQAIGMGTKVPYLAMAGETARPPGVFCDSGFSCAVGDHVSFDNNGNPLTRFDNPGQIFDQLFMGLTPGMTNTQAAAMAAAMRAQDKSVLDLVTSEATSLEGKLSRQDKPRLDEYLTSIRQVEQRIANLQTAMPSTCMPPTRVSTAFNLSDPRGSIDIAHELMALAFQCDATRVLSFQWGNSTTNRPHTMIQASGGHHDTSHHGMDATMIAKIQRIDYWWFRRFTALITRLQGMTDIDGRTVLDNTLIFQSTDVSDGAMHNHNDMPVVLAGGAAGFRLGQHIDVTPPGSSLGAGGGNGSGSTATFTGSWFGDLFLAIGKGFGLNLTSFGEHSSNPIPCLT